ncbi:MAG: T9SS type A sorting domain-containing protein [Bacteroidia bacterium]|nr:T9SS type A sorting domain-containing protein [Bacteroidia bacterium]
MKFHIRLLLSFLLVSPVLLAQNDTTRILFIGNSFTYYHNMPQMVKAFADSADKPVIVGMHAPGGISVGDTVQGNMAHMNNPVLFQLIRSQKWDFAVIQDNQGRFVRDSATFPGSSKVVQGHLNIMDSVKANNSCAKIVLFAGWAFKNGSPPFGNTGIEMIERILVNYCVLNDTMKEVIAPIGEAWIKSHSQVPSVNLWDADDAHPSYAGSYLTASVIFSSIFSTSCTALMYNGALPALTAANLRAFADSAVFKISHHSKYNLGAVRHPGLNYSSGVLSVVGNYSSYAWYKDGAYIGSSASMATQGNGYYQAIVEENDGCILKTCEYSELTTGLQDNDLASNIRLYPNPTRNEVFIETNQKIENIQLWDAAGVPVTLARFGSVVSLTGIKPGCYILEFGLKSGPVRKKIVVVD